MISQGRSTDGAVPSRGGSLVSDIFEKCLRFVERPRIVKPEDQDMAVGLFSAVSPPENAGPWIGNGRKMLQFATNDYLGLANNGEVRAQAAAAATMYGIGSPMGSRLLTGNTAEALEFERDLAKFKRCEAALTFTSGALAMMGALGSLASPRDLLIMDEHVHTTLNCGAKISGAEVMYFRHNDLGHLKRIVARHANSRPTAIVVDGIYSMAGDMSPLQEIAALKERYHCRLIVDDAHGTGVFGENGRGTAAHLGVESAVDLHCGTFSKAFGTIGGFLTGSAPIIEYLRYNAPTYVFTKAVPLVVIAATQASLELVRNGDDRRARLWHNRKRLQEGLLARGFSIGNTESPITPIQFQGNEALYIAHKLRTSYGIWSAPAVYPAVPMGRSILRVIPTAAHTDADVDYLLEGITEIRASMILGSLAQV